MIPSLYSLRNLLIDEHKKFFSSYTQDWICYKNGFSTYNGEPNIIYSKLLKNSSLQTEKDSLLRSLNKFSHDLFPNYTIKFSEDSDKTIIPHKINKEISKEEALLLHEKNEFSKLFFDLDYLLIEHITYVESSSLRINTIADNLHTFTFVGFCYKQNFALKLNLII